ncbi:MAG: succinate dehydrogenase assembly factor 2 [Porticoccaceae bacterium]
MDHNRLRWAARRGMLELDLLLTTFVERGYAQAEPEDQARFERLLTCEDQDLFGWLMGRTEPPDADLKAIVAAVLDVRRAAP